MEKIEELIKEAILEATWWEHKLTLRQKSEIPVGEARAEVVDYITKKLLKKIK